MSRSQQKQRPEPIADKSYVMPWGKYKGYSIAGLMLDDPQYLLWLVSKTDFELSSHIMDEIEESFVDAAFNATLRKEIKGMSIKDYLSD